MISPSSFSTAAQLVDAAEYRFGLGGDQALADAEGVDLCALYDEVAHQILIERVGRHDLHIRETGVVEHLAGLYREVRDVAGIQTDALGADAPFRPFPWRRGWRSVRRI